MTRITGPRDGTAPDRLDFEDVALGDAPRALVKGPLTTMHLMRWSASVENFHRIHYDRSFAVEHDMLPDLLINGALKQQFLFELLKTWAGPTGWVWKVNFQFRRMNIVGDTLTTWGRVTALHSSRDFGLVDLDIGITGDGGQESTPGRAVLALPYRGGAPVPYPFVPPVPEAQQVCTGCSPIVT